MTRIVAIGECMVEMAPTAASGEYRMGFAGDTMNTAWYLRKLMPPSSSIDYFTAVGSDAVSDSMVDFLSSAGLGTRLIQRRSDRTVGLYMIRLDRGERSFSYWRGQSAARTLASDQQVLEQALSGADVAYFSGITLAILPMEDRHRLIAALKAFRSDGGQVVFDPNLRPRLWDSTHEMVDITMQAAGVSDLALPSFDDEATWFGDADPAVTASRYAATGATTVIVKNGHGRIFATENGATSFHDPVPVTDIVDTTAAGDSFNAGFLASRLNGEPVAKALVAGSQLAARVVRGRGALVADIG